MRVHVDHDGSLCASIFIRISAGQVWIATPARGSGAGMNMAQRWDNGQCTRCQTMMGSTNTKSCVGAMPDRISVLVQI